MNENCRTCGKPLPEDAPVGSCPHCLLAEGLSSKPSESDTAPPDVAEMADRFPALEVLEVLGRGGMGVVYKARQKNLDRTVALKIVAPVEGDRAAFAERFGREARTMARLDHPHIVKVYDFGETDGLYYLVMEYVEGVNLRQAMQGGELGPQSTLAIVPQICDALQYAHDQGVVHRDIKPENILLDKSGTVKIADFGLAKLLNPSVNDHTITGTGQVMGTFHYMAPEQYRTPGEVDHRADIYSLGVVFYEMLTGELPVGRFAPPSERVSVDVRLDEVVLRTLEQERERRYQKASEIRTRIDSIADDSAPPPFPSAPPAQALESEAVKSRLSRMAVIGGLAIPGSLVIGIILALVIGALLPPDTAKSVIGIVGLALGVGIVLGFLFSLISWIRIGSSGGRLRGLGFAVIGTILPVLLGLVLVPLVVLLVMPVREVIEPPVMYTGEEIGIGGGPAPRPEPATPLSSHSVVITGGIGLGLGERIAIADSIGRRLQLLLQCDAEDPLASVSVRKLYGNDPLLPAVESNDPRDLIQLRAQNRTGLPLFPPANLPKPLKAYRISEIKVADDGRTAKVTAWAGPGHGIEFGMRKSQGLWWFDFGEVKVK